MTIGWNVPFGLFREEPYGRRLIFWECVHANAFEVSLDTQHVKEHLTFIVRSGRRLDVDIEERNGIIRVKNWIGCLKILRQSFCRRRVRLDSSQLVSYWEQRTPPSRIHYCRPRHVSDSSLVRGGDRGAFENEPAEVEGEGLLTGFRRVLLKAASRTGRSCSKTPPFCL